MANEGTEYEPGKLFVGGLSWETTKENLREYFIQFGEIADCTVMYNSENKHRGFGFVTFSNPAIADVALQYKTKGGPGSTEEGHFIDGKKVDPKKAIKSGQAPKVKLFLGGIPENTSADDIRRVFSVFGPIPVEGVELKYDKESGKCRGFGFLTFERQQDADRAMLERYVEINGKRVEVKKAENSSKPMGGKSGYPQGYGDSRMYGGGYPSPGGYSQMTPQQQQQQQAGAYGYGSGAAGYPAAYQAQWSGYNYGGGSAGGAAGYYPTPQGSNPASSYNGGAYASTGSYNPSRTDSTGAYASAVPQAQGYNNYSQSQQPQQALYGYGQQQGYSGRSQEQQGYNNGFPSRQ